MFCDKCPTQDASVYFFVHEHNETYCPECLDMLLFNAPDQKKFTITVVRASKFFLDMSIPEWYNGLSNEREVAA